MISLKSSTIIILIALLISVMGVLSIYSSTYQKDDFAGGQDIYKRQVLWVLIGLAIFFALSRLNYRLLWDATYILYGLAVLFLFLVFFLGTIRLGAQRWLRLGGFNFQPSEFAKLIMVVFLSRYFTRKSVSDISVVSAGYGIVRGLILPALFVTVPVLFIFDQPDLGSAAMILMLFVAILYLTNLRFKYFIILMLVILLPLPFLWHALRDYQKERLLVFLNPNIDPLGAGYTIIQSKITIGSGGFFGKGWLSGTQGQLHFLPESHTDFIFATFCEEWGLMGSLVLLLLYFFLIRQGLLIAQRTRDQFGSLLAFGISLMLGIQILINICMNMGLAPVVGLPLPLMSYGGSSVIVTFASLGILANIDRTRSVF
jgi:rod shape determining protein RodA